MKRLDLIIILLMFSNFISGGNTPDRSINLSIGKTSFFIPEDYLLRLSEVIVLGATDGCERKIQALGDFGEITDTKTITNLSYITPCLLLSSITRTNTTLSEAIATNTGLLSVANKTLFNTVTGTNTRGETANTVATKPCITAKQIIYAVPSSVENIYVITTTNSISDLPSNSGGPVTLDIADASATRCNLFFIQAQPLRGEKIFVNKTMQVACI
jgi:hypothetical protein